MAVALLNARPVTGPDRRHDAAGETPKRAMEVLRYFIDHPGNAESLEGMARWRLAEESIHRSVSEIDEALNWLVDQGLLLERRTPATDATFFINPDRLPQAREWLQRGRRETLP